MRIHTITTGIAAVLLCTQVLRADKEVTTPEFDLPIKANVVVEESQCQNAQGPTITLNGSISLGGVAARLTFSNNLKGTKQTSVLSEYDFTLVNEGNTIQIPKQPVRGGVGGNPHIYLQFTDSAGAGVSEEFYLGRCVQGLSLTSDLVQSAIVHGNVHVDDCSGKGGPTITLDGDIVVSGLNAKIILRNNAKGTHTAEVSVNVTLMGDGSVITLPKQAKKGGVGGNPIIGIQFLHSDSSPISDPTTLGRCNQL